METLIITRKRSGNILVVFIAVTLALFLVTSFTGVAFARSNMQGHEGIVKGEIVSVDTSHKTPTLTLNEAGKLSPANPNAELNIFLTNKTNLKMCKAEKPLKDFKAGEKVSVSYHELAGLAVADRISKPC